MSSNKNKIMQKEPKMKKRM